MERCFITNISKLSDENKQVNLKLLQRDVTEIGRNFYDGIARRRMY